MTMASQMRPVRAMSSSRHMRAATGMAATRAFRIGRDIMFMRGGAEGRETLIVSVRRLDFFAILDRARLRHGRACGEYREHEAQSDGDAAEWSFVLPYLTHISCR
jgi:hypothetical protein